LKFQATAEKTAKILGSYFFCSTLYWRGDKKRAHSERKSWPFQIICDSKHAVPLSYLR